MEISISQISSSINQLSLDIDEARKQKRKYTQLEPNKNLIDLPYYKNDAVQLDKELCAAREAKAWLEQHTQAVQLILRSLPTLARIPDESKLERLENQITQLKKARSTLSFQRDALTHLIAVIDNFQYLEDEKVYEENSSILEARRAQLEPAKERQNSTRQDYEKARGAVNDARKQLSLDEATFNQAELEKSRLTEKFEAMGLMGTDEECQLAQKALEEAITAAKKARDEHLEQVKNHAEAATLLKSSENELSTKNTHTSEKLSSLRKERHAKNELDHVVNMLHLRGKIDTQANRQQFFPTGNLINAFQESLTQSHLLFERLKAYPDVQNEVKAIAQFSQTTEERRAIQTLKVWERVHRHIEQRIPRNIATSDDPKTALGQMHEKMQELRRTLDAQENEMRVRSSGVSNAIRSRLRTAGFLINRLNLELEQVSFGSIRGVRIMKEEPQHMSEMLKALQDDGNRSIFDTETPLEETLAKMYERIGGGRTVGSKLLDYRNYITLRLEIKRINGKWDVTDGVSTGEAIGVGAAILVMILRTWNTEAKRISGTAAGQSMQQILLDEANRLDPDALDTFTEFCERMDVQALVAAPGLERPRRSTVFLLERGMVNNREQVTIRGQRITA